MAIPLPHSTGNVAPEYAATSINFNRQVQNINGELVAIFTAQLSYERKDYLIVDNKKVGIISADPTQINYLAHDTTAAERYGNILLTATDVGVLFSQMPPANKVLGEVIADLADDLIKQDLIKRGIIIT